MIFAIGGCVSRRSRPSAAHSRSRIQSGLHDKNASTPSTLPPYPNVGNRKFSFVFGVFEFFNYRYRKYFSYPTVLFSPISETFRFLRSVRTALECLMRAGESISYTSTVERIKKNKRTDF